MLRAISCSVAGLLAIAVAAAHAQEPSVSQIYGRGVHAFFSGDYAQACDDLTAAVVANAQDPRVYYFRGLAELRLGRHDEAVADFALGGKIEAASSATYYNIARSLERIQGSDRVLLERYRLNARNAAVAETERVRKARYEDLQREENRVLRQPSITKMIPPEELPAASPTRPRSVDAAAPGGESSPDTSAASPFDAPATSSSESLESPPVEPNSAPITLEKPESPIHAETPQAHLESPFPQSAPTNAGTPPAAPTAPTAPAAGGRAKSGSLMGALGRALGRAVAKPVEGAAGMMGGQPSPRGAMMPPGGGQMMPGGFSPADENSPPPGFMPMPENEGGAGPDQSPMSAPGGAPFDGPVPSGEGSNPFGN